MSEPGGIDLGKEVGPLPVGAWLAVVGVGVGIVVWTRRSATPAAPVVMDPTQGIGYPIGGAPDPTLLPNYAGGGVVGGAAPAPTTNEEWLRRAMTDLIGRGYEPGAVDLALRSYLQGETLDQRGKAIVEAALRYTGPPPSPAPLPMPGNVTGVWSQPWTRDATKGYAVDSGNGRRAYYGPHGEPAGPLAPNQVLKPGEAKWQMLDGPAGAPGTWVVYRPWTFAYGDPTRKPNLPAGFSAAA